MVGWHHRLNGHGFGWTPGNFPWAFHKAGGVTPAFLVELVSRRGPFHPRPCGPGVVPSLGASCVTAAVTPPTQGCRFGPIRFLCPWDSPVKNTGVGCHSLPQRIFPTQACPTLCNPLDCSPPGSSVHGDSPGRNARVGCPVLLQGIFLTQGSNLGVLCSQADSLPI